MLGGGNPLTVGVGIIIEVIRKNNSDYDPDVLLEAQHEPTSRDPIYLGTLLRLFADSVPKFMDLIMDKPAQGDGVDSTFGNKLQPLGFDRFKTCELMAELLHCSNMGLLNEEGIEKLIFSRDAERLRLRAWGNLQTHTHEEESGEGLTMRSSHGHAQEGRKLEVTNADDDGFEEVEGDSKGRENLSTELSAADLSTEKDDDFVDEPLSSPRLDASKDKVNEHTFEDPELVVAPLSPKKTAAAELDKPDDDKPSTETKEAQEAPLSEKGASSTDGAADAASGLAAKPTPVLLTVPAASETTLTIRELSPHPEDTPAPLFSGQSASDPAVDTSATDLGGDRTVGDSQTAGISTQESIGQTQTPAETDESGPAEPLVGDYLKAQFVEHRVVPVILVC